MRNGFIQWLSLLFMSLIADFSHAAVEDAGDRSEWYCTVGTDALVHLRCARLADRDDADDTAPETAPAPRSGLMKAALTTGQRWVRAADDLVEIPLYGLPYNLDSVRDLVKDMLCPGQRCLVAMRWERP